jgi:hypothetical protein
MVTDDCVAHRINLMMMLADLANNLRLTDDCVAHRINLNYVSILGPYLRLTDDYYRVRKSAVWLSPSIASFQGLPPTKQDIRSFATLKLKSHTTIPPTVTLACYYGQVYEAGLSTIGYKCKCR